MHTFTRIYILHTHFFHKEWSSQQSLGPAEGNALHDSDFTQLRVVDTKPLAPKQRSFRARLLETSHHSLVATANILNRIYGMVPAT